MDPNNLTIAGLLLAGLGVVSTAVGVLWRKLEAYAADIMCRLKECEDDREELWKRVADLYQHHNNRKD